MVTGTRFSDVTVHLTTVDTSNVRAKVLRIKLGSERAVEYAPSDPAVRRDVEQHIRAGGDAGAATLPLELLIRAFEAQLAVTAPELVGRKWALFCGFEGKRADNNGGGGKRVIPMFRVGIHDKDSTEGQTSLSSLLLPFVSVDTVEAMVWSARLSFVVLPSEDGAQRGGYGIPVHVAVVNSFVGEGAEKSSESRHAIETKILMKKDPNAPMLHKTALFFYCAEMRSIFVRQHGEAAGLKLMVRSWKEADEATRAKFEALAKADRDRYEREFREYSLRR